MASSTLKADAMPSASNCRKQNEPQICNALRFGLCAGERQSRSVDTRVPDYNDDSRDREHARRISVGLYRERSDSGNRRGTPANVVFLTADAFGVLPPISK